MPAGSRQPAKQGHLARRRIEMHGLGIELRREGNDLLLAHLVRAERLHLTDDEIFQEDVGQGGPPCR